MSLDLTQEPSAPVTGVDDLVSLFKTFEKAPEQQQLGLEHEKLLVDPTTRRAPPYPGGVGLVLQRFVDRGFTPFRELPGGPIIAVEKEGSTISLEPGGQLELSGRPALTARAAHEENVAHLETLRGVMSDSSLMAITMGYRPFDRLREMPWMPKRRYDAMRATLVPRGELAENMMLMTATGQVSVDYCDEADCVRKMTAVTRINPTLVAMFANSAVVEGRASGFLSYRSHVWTRVDPARCGDVPALFGDGFGYRAYVEWALDAPMLFLRRGGDYLRPGLTFREFLKSGLGEHRATMADWKDHLSTLFPEVRLKNVIEVRGADGVPLPLTGSLLALVRGLLYDATAMEEVAGTFPARTLEQHQIEHGDARRLGFRAACALGTQHEAAKTLLKIAQRGLHRLDPLDAPLLDPLESLVESGKTLAERALDVVRSPDRLLKEFAIDAAG